MERLKCMNTLSNNYKNRLKYNGEGIIYRDYLVVSHIFDVTYNYWYRRGWGDLKTYIKNHEKMKKPGSYIKLYNNWEVNANEKIKINGKLKTRLTKNQIKTINKEIKNMKADTSNEDFMLYENKFVF